MLLRFLIPNKCSWVFRDNLFAFLFMKYEHCFTEVDTRLCR